MGNLSYTVTSARPRTICSAAQWAALPTHGAYGTIDPTFLTRLRSEANSIAAATTAFICRNDNGAGSPRDDIHKKVLTLCVAQQALASSTASTTLLAWRLKAQDVALYVVNTVIGLGQYETDSRRSSLLALAYTLDLIYSSHAPSTISTIGSGIITLCDAMSQKGGGTSDPQNDPEMFDGHTAGDQACQFIAGVALHGESGFTSGGSNAATRVAEAVNYYWGGETTLTYQGESRLAFNRYFCANGGHGKSVWYSMLEGWYTALILACAENSLTSVTLSGEAYTLPGSESWIDSVGEWFVNFAARGDIDYWHVQGDTSRITNPWMHEYTSTTLSYLISRSPTWRAPLRWVYDKILQKTMVLNQNSVPNRVADFCLFDPASATYAPVHPGAHGVPTSKLMDPPGIYVYRNNWDIGGAGHCAMVLEAQRYFWRGHSTDLKCGSIQINVNDDIVLMNRGFYSTNTANADIADFGGTYTNNWTRQSISASGVPLIDDLASPASASPNYAGTPHTNAGPTGVSTPYPHAQGGQLFRWDPTAGAPPPVPVDPITITKMTSDGGGLTWLRVTGINGSLTDGLKVEDETDDLVFLTADLRRAYLSRVDHYDTANDRLEICTLKFMVIKDPHGDGSWPFPCFFRVAKVRARQASYVKRDVWNFYGNPVMADFATDGSFYASGFRAVQEGEISMGGKCLIAYHNHEDYRADPSGDSSADYTAANANHHAFTIGNTATLSRFPLGGNPSTSLGGRQITDVGRWRVEIRPLVQQQENTFVNLIVPMGKDDVEPDFTLLEDATYWMVRFGGETSDRVFKIHKSAISYQGPTDPLDDIEPAQPTGVTATAGPGTGQVTVGWNPPPEPDYRATRVFYRIKV